MTFKVKTLYISFPELRLMKDDEFVSKNIINYVLFVALL